MGKEAILYEKLPKKSSFSPFIHVFTKFYQQFFDTKISHFTILMFERSIFQQNTCNNLGLNLGSTGKNAPAYIILLFL